MFLIFQVGSEKKEESLCGSACPVAPADGTGVAGKRKNRDGPIVLINPKTGNKFDKERTGGNAEAGKAYGQLFKQFGM